MKTIISLGISFILSIFCELSAGSFTIVVKDPEGNPIPDTNLMVGFHEGSNYESGGKEGTTDENGEYRFSGELYWGFCVLANKEGYYQTGEEFDSTYHDDRKGLLKSTRSERLRLC